MHKCIGCCCIISHVKLGLQSHLHYWLHAMVSVTSSSALFRP
jgi:hypothetical protein